MSLADAPFSTSFPHGAAQLRVLVDPEFCPKCHRGVLLVVVQPSGDACCLGCMGGSESECPGCALVMTETEQARGWCDACERERVEQAEEAVRP